MVKTYTKILSLTLLLSAGLSFAAGEDDQKNQERAYTWKECAVAGAGLLAAGGVGHVIGTKMEKARSAAAQAAALAAAQTQTKGLKEVSDAFVNLGGALASTSKEYADVATTVVSDPATQGMISKALGTAGQALKGNKYLTGATVVGAVALYKREAIYNKLNDLDITSPKIASAIRYGVPTAVVGGAAIIYREPLKAFASAVCEKVSEVATYHPVATAITASVATSALTCGAIHYMTSARRADKAMKEFEQAHKVEPAVAAEPIKLEADPSNQQK